MTNLTDFEQLLAQKMMLGVRFFSGSSLGTTDQLTAVTSVPTALEEFLSSFQLAGVVLFSENLLHSEQICSLTAQLQELNQRAGATSEMLIGIDQEGGRVVRLPRSVCSSFTGSMAIGATHKRFGTQYASEIGTVIGESLSRVGINVNFAPVLDINTNPANPVINVRSYSDDPHLVAELGLATVDAIQSQNVMACIKHFPGHGSTSVDSHLELPQIDVSLEVLQKSDLIPFQYVVEHTSPAMIMTAHIQFPAIDDEKVPDTSGNLIYPPASLSRRLLTGILRKRMGFNGLIVSDALNMAGISAHFDLADATARAFHAGVDIVTLPYAVQNQDDILSFVPFVKDVAKKLLQLDDATTVRKWTYESVRRISDVKSRFLGDGKYEYSELTHCHRVLESDLARYSVSALVTDTAQFPIRTFDHSKDEFRLHVVAVQRKQLSIARSVIPPMWSEFNESELVASYATLSEIAGGTVDFAGADALVVLYQSTLLSDVDLGEAGDGNGLEPDSTKESTPISTQQELQDLLDELIKSAAGFDIPVSIVATQSPYDIQSLLTSGGLEKTSNLLVAYFGGVFADDGADAVTAPGISAALSALFGKETISGEIPVSLS